MDPLAGAGLKKILELLFEAGKELLMEGRLTKKKKLALQDIKKAEQLLLSGSDNLIQIKALLESARSVLHPSVPVDLTRVQEMLNSAAAYSNEKKIKSKKTAATKRRVKKKSTSKKKTSTRKNSSSKKKSRSKKTSSSKRKTTLKKKAASKKKVNAKKKAGAKRKAGATKKPSAKA